MFIQCVTGGGRFGGLRQINTCAKYLYWSVLKKSRHLGFGDFIKVCRYLVHGRNHLPGLLSSFTYGFCLQNLVTIRDSDPAPVLFWRLTEVHFFRGGFFLIFFFILHCFVCLPSDFTVSVDARIKPGTVVTLALTFELSKHLARSHSHSARSHPRI